MNFLKWSGRTKVSQLAWLMEEDITEGLRVKVALLSRFFKRWSCGIVLKRKDPLAMGTRKGPNKHPHMSTHTLTHSSSSINLASQTQAHTQTHTRPQAMRTVLHEHTHYISPEVRQKSKDLTRQVKGIQRLEAAERRR